MPLLLVPAASLLSCLFLHISNQTWLKYPIEHPQRHSVINIPLHFTWSFCRMILITPVKIAESSLLWFVLWCGQAVVEVFHLSISTQLSINIKAVNIKVELVFLHCLVYVQWSSTGLLCTYFPKGTTCTAWKI